ncbi:Por secretion system C-terminal sorting domain-containing protein [Catalinimonas alkaloidigena]|uniref:Por secretion system C-terminal sorting domain-containing protein n=1 Tax=Catalinimonas alkaloidigena TaxID=1075417 RepID=A0A1G8Y6H5_9BACT|nr:T9SS type A sorting domain-containing protein [Catalinimonas alkaloidigena]SDJ97994.1 Por secretion system C-terminal sorting domain-containing protein [Catalinimonas alkaloidigena]
MKHSLRFLLSLGLMVLPSLLVRAQCTLAPTITPNNLMLCPNAQDTIWTQEYDAYQWYRYLNFGENPQIDTLEGDTLQYLVVDQYEDAGFTFQVAVTQDTCTALSPGVMVDGWAFAGLTVALSGSFGINPEDGHVILCDTSGMFRRDTLTMVINLPYKYNIQWFENGEPIEGATDDTLVVSRSGSYTVQGSPEECLDFSLSSLPIEVEFRQPPRPLIARRGDTLEITNADELMRLQWYLEGDTLPGATAATYVPTEAGIYTVSADDNACYGMSQPFAFDTPTATPEYLSARIRLYPNPAQTNLTLETPVPLRTQLTNLTGQVVLQTDATTIDVQALATGVYVVRLFDKNGVPIRQEKLVIAR